MPEQVVEQLHVGGHVLDLPRWQCAWCPLRLADRAAVARHEATCAQREHGG